MRPGASLAGLAAAFGVLAGLFSWLETRFRSAPTPLFFRRADFRTDLAYWLFTPLVSRAFTRATVALSLAAIVRIAGGSFAALRSDLAAGRAPEIGWAVGREALHTLPFALQLGLGLLVADFLSYWMHRAFHARWLWPLHAVHHSSPHLDWLSSVRLHPFNQATMSVAQALPLLALGFDPRIFASVAPLLTTYAILVHANVGWSLGPLARAIASPRFHRWHHTSAQEGRDKNFAGLLPLWDLAFGTYFLPRGRVPTEFGAGDEPVPAGIMRQLLYPFRRPTAGEPLARDRG